MFIDFRELFPKYLKEIKGVIQVGAHWVEEHDVFIDLGVKNIVYIEPCKEAFQIMITKLSEKYGLPKEGGLIPLNGERMYSICSFKNQKVNIKCFEVACGENEGIFDMYVSNNNQGQSNSLLQPNLHLQQHPEVIFTEMEEVKVVPLNSLVFDRDNFNILVMDCQGAEGLVLKGATETLKNIDLIYTEINTGQTYEGNMEVDEMDNFLNNFDFVRVETYMPSPNLTWGDACYVRKTLLQ